MLHARTARRKINIQIIISNIISTPIHFKIFYPSWTPPAAALTCYMHLTEQH